MSKANLLSKLSSLTGIVKLTSGDPSALVDTDSITFADYNLNAISSTLTGTAVAVFVYDTRNDSDGGAWRKRCQHTSWYNETLNTATRGATREFPAVALIVALSNSITIYDATVSTCPMWMKFNRTGNQLGWGSITSIFMINSILYVGSNYNSTNGELYITPFIKDDHYYITASYQTVRSDSIVSGIVDRNTVGTAGIPFSSTTIVNDKVNCITGTILQNSPIDPITGLPNPVIYIGTPAGVSRIYHDGTVTNWTDNSGSSVHQVFNIGITDNYVYWAASSNDIYGYYINTSNINNVLSSWNYSTTRLSYTDSRYQNWAADRTPIHFNGYTPGSNDISKNAIAFNGFMTLIKPNSNSFGSGLHAIITKDFNTGFIFGDARGSYLCEGTTDTITSGTSLITGDSSTFTSGVGSWTVSGGESSIAAVGGKLELTTNGTQSTFTSSTSLTITTVIGKTYNISADVEKISGRGDPHIGVNNMFGYNPTIGTSTINVTFTATATSTVVQLFEGGTTAETAGLSLRADNITCYVVAGDYSYKIKPLSIVGSLTRSAVNTNSELTYHTGFSTSNYLTQAYRSDLDFGTGDFYISAWIKKANTSGHSAIFARQDNGVTSFGDGGYISLTLRDSTGYALLALTGGTTLFTTINICNNVWNKLDFVRSNGVCSIYVNGVLNNSAANTSNLTNVNASTFVGIEKYNGTLVDPGPNISLLKISGNAPTADQIKFMYSAEKPLFSAGAKCLLAGTSNDVKAIDYDESTGIHHLVTGDYYNAFKGLQRVDSAAGTWTSISAKNDYIIKGA